MGPTNILGEKSIDDITTQFPKLGIAAILENTNEDEISWDQRIDGKTDTMVRCAQEDEKTYYFYVTKFTLGELGEPLLRFYMRLNSDFVEFHQDIEDDFCLSADDCLEQFTSYIHQ